MNNTVKHAMPLGDVASRSDYYAQQQVHAMSGIWALVWAVAMPLVGFCLGIRAIVRGRKHNRAVLKLGILAVIVSVVVPVAVGMAAVFAGDSGIKRQLGSPNLTQTNEFTSQTAKLQGRYPAQFSLYDETASSISYATLTSSKTRQVDRMYQVSFVAETELGGRSIQNMTAALESADHPHRIAVLSALERVTRTTFTEVKETRVDGEYLYVTLEEAAAESTSGYLMSLAIKKATYDGYLVTSYWYPGIDTLFEPLIYGSPWAEMVRANQDIAFTASGDSNE